MGKNLITEQGGFAIMRNQNSKGTVPNSIEHEGLEMSDMLIRSLPSN